VKLYLLRHAIAFPRDTPGVRDEDRSLTDEGREKMQREAAGIAHIVKTFDVILTSPYKRAYETAMITAQAMGLSKAVNVFDALKPGTLYAVFMKALASYADKKDVLLVGHEPDMSTFAAALCGMPQPNIGFKKGSICCIEVDRIPPQHHGVLLWLLTPGQARALGTR
jgi:phosphohistidine phosphatase